MADPDTLWLAPMECERTDCKREPGYSLWMGGNLSDAGPDFDPCPVCGREPTEYRRVET